MIANAAHLPAIAYLDNIYEVVGVSDLRLSAAQETAARFGIKNIYTNNQKMLDELKPELVIVATPNAYHKEVSLMALRSGADVICEKPIALKYADAIEMFAEAEKNGCHLFPAQTARFCTEHESAKRVIDANTLGEIYFAEFTAIRRRGIPKWGYFHMKDFNVGGPFCDLAVHEIDMMLWNMGNPEVLAVSGNAWTRIGNNGIELETSAQQSGAHGGIQITPRPYDWHEFDVEDMASGIIRLAGGKQINFKTSWAVNLPEKWERKYAGTKAGLIYGEDITPVIYGDICGWQADIIPAVFDQKNYPDNICFPGHIDLLRNVANFLDGKEELIIKKEQTLNVTAAIEAFYTSVETDREVCCETFKEKI